jgi:beta-lactam-binding protein with PASTA domain
MGRSNGGEINMKKIAGILIVMILSSVLGFPLLSGAVSFSPVPAEREEKAAKGTIEKGAIVCLFQSGTADVKKAISIGDILIVHREGPKHELKEVGKIKVLFYAGEDYLRGEVVEGEIKAGDIAKKGDAASLVISSGDKCK